MSLDRFFDGVADIPDKNRGGCLFFCYAFWKWCKINNIPTDTYDVIQWEASYEHGKIEQNLQFLHHGMNDLDSSAHFAWTFDGELYDGYGLTTYESNTRPGDNYENITNGNHDRIEEFFIRALNEDIWNTTFLRNIAIRNIKDRLDLDLHEVRDKFYNLHW